MSARYPQKNFITAVPAGASETGTIKLAPGAYYLYFYGTHTNAGTADTLLFEAHVNEAQSDEALLAVGLSDDATIAATAVTLDAAKTALYGSIYAGASIQSSNIPVYLRYGLQYTYTKQGATAVDLTLVAIPVNEL